MFRTMSRGLPALRDAFKINLIAPSETRDIIAPQECTEAWRKYRTNIPPLANNLRQNHKTQKRNLPLNLNRMITRVKIAHTHLTPLLANH